MLIQIFLLDLLSHLLIFEFFEVKLNLFEIVGLLLRSIIILSRLSLSIIFDSSKLLLANINLVELLLDVYIFFESTRASMKIAPLEIFGGSRILLVLISWFRIHKLSHSFFLGIGCTGASGSDVELILELVLVSNLYSLLGDVVEAPLDVLLVVVSFSGILDVGSLAILHSVLDLLVQNSFQTHLLKGEVLLDDLRYLLVNLSEWQPLVLVTT